MDSNSIISQMSLNDKIALCSGASFWETKKFEKYGIPAMFVSDGPHGLRRQDLAGKADMLGLNRSRPATCFPAEVTTASSWNTDLLEKIGSAIGEEARAQGVGVVLGPGCNIKRNPLCGRNFEYFSEDPVLSGKLAAAFISGVESTGTGTSLKHFAANSQEKSRFNSDSVMDERTLRELYLAGFETAVKEGRPATVMCAYNKLNGVHCSDSEHLLTQILRCDWGFDGMVITDWGAMNDRIAAFRAGCDLNMPGGSEYMESEALKAVESGVLPESAIDACAARILRQVFRAAETLRTAHTFDEAAHHALAKKAAAEGAVLLKNDRNLLPIDSEKSIAIIGAMAENMRYQGSGSSHINPTRLSQPLDFFPGAKFAAGCEIHGDTSDALIAEAVSIAAAADIAIVFAGLPDIYESEGYDRDDMRMPEGHLRMIEAVARSNTNTVVVLMCGSAVECPWADHVPAILYTGLPGQAGGEAIAELIYGRLNPSGKLAETWPLKYNDVPTSDIYAKTKDALYMEAMYSGYRYYDKAAVNVRWSFGHGLSYTTFSYTNLTASRDSASVTVKNTGNRAGAEVVQLYVAAPQTGLHRPVRELKSFRKVYLQPGESTNVTFNFTDRTFALWNDGWKIPGGTYRVMISTLAAEISIPGDAIPAPSWQSGNWYETCSGKPDKSQWESMLGRNYSPVIHRKGEFTMDDSIEEMKESSLLMRLMYNTIRLVLRLRSGKNAENDPEYRMLINSTVGSPLRNMQICGGIKGHLMNHLLAIANLRIFKR